MLVFTQRYLKILAIILVVMVLYGLTVVPLIEPIHQADYAIPTFQSTLGGQRWWSGLFDDQDWQVKQPTVVQNSNGVLLAETWQQVDQKTWRLTPLTMVLTQGNIEESSSEQTSTDQTVWIVSAERGATIHFDQPLDLKSGQVPSIQRGQLEGAILIQRVSLANPQTPSLQLSTQNVSIDRRRIWTQDDVIVQSPQAMIRGRVLRISLLSDILSKHSEPKDESTEPRFGPLEEIELLQLNEFRMNLPPGGLWASASPRLLSTSQPVADLPAMVQAECGGRFTFDFSKELATLNGGVHLKHFLGQLPPDEFHCHKLNIRLDSPVTPPTSSASAQSNSLSQIAVREIEAFGIDSLEDYVGEMWVELKSPLLGATARAKRIRYDLIKQRIELDGKLDQPGATNSIAELHYRGYQFRAPTLEYQAAPKLANGRSAHLGWMAAQGAGEISTSPESPMGEVHIRWRDSFNFAPTQVTGEQWIELLGKTLIESSRYGFITSDRLQLWMNDLSTDRSPSTATARQMGLQPKRLTTAGATSIAFQNTRANIGAMDLSFVYPAFEDSPDALELVPQEATTDTSAQPSGWLSSTSTRPNSADDQSSSEAYEILGQDLKATVAVLGQRMRLDELTIQGPLSLKSASPETRTPVEVRGQSLALSTSSDGEIDLKIDGQPAQVLMADGSFSGPSIRYNQHDNRIWMDQPGEFTLPTHRLNNIAGTGTMQWEMPLHCSWQDRMYFDGQTVRLEGGIALTGAVRQSAGVWLLEGLCSEMDLQLSQPIRFPSSDTRPENADTAAHLEQIILRQQVDLRVAQRNAAGDRVSLERLLVPQLTIFVPQEKVVATGPGLGISKFMTGRPIGSLSSSRARSLQQLQCAHLTFRDSLVAFLNRREVVADGSVNITTSQIDNWDQNFDPKSIARFSPGQMSVTSDQLKLYDTSSLSSTQSARTVAGSSADHQLWEVQASGNVVFDGSTESGDYAGSAYQVTYVQAKELLSMRGDGRSKAALRRIPTPTLTEQFPNPTVVQVDSAVFNMKTMGLEESQGLYVHVDFQSGGSNSDSTAPSGSPSNQLPPTVQPPNPRDGINNFLRGF
jgi:hypothetical protein